MRNDIALNDRAAKLGDRLIKKLETVYDPEIGLDIYNLGLIYKIDLAEDGHCHIVITFTEVACGCMDTLPKDLVAALTQLDEINRVTVEVVWSPTWQVTRISRLGRAMLGISIR